MAVKSQEIGGDYRMPSAIGTISFSSAKRFMGTYHPCWKKCGWSAGGQPCRSTFYAGNTSPRPAPGHQPRHRCQTSPGVRRQLQVNEGGLDPSTPQPPSQVVQRNPVEQHVPGKAVPQRMGPNTSGPRGFGRLQWPVGPLVVPTSRPRTGDTSINLPSPTAPKLVTAVRAVCSSGWTGTTRPIVPCPAGQTVGVGLSPGAGPGLPGPGPRIPGGRPAIAPA